MFQDMLRDPAKYEDGVSDLLVELVSGQKKLPDLSPEETALLDRATIDLSRPSSTKPSPRPERSLEKTAQKPSSEGSVLKASEPPMEEAIPKDLLPDEEAVPFWFR